MYNAFQIDKFADYANSGETNYDVINNIEDNILRTMNREKTLSQNGKITGSIAQNAKVFSVNNIEWYVVPLGTESLSEAEDAPNYSQRVDKFLTPSAHMLTPEDIELNFDLSEYPWRGSIKSATVNGIGCITVYRTLLTEDGEFGTTGEKWFSSEFYTKYSSNFVSPFAKYEYARITSHFGYRGAVNGIETLKIHGGVDMSAYLNEASPTLGKDVCATGSGVVAESGWSGYGNYVIIDHGNGISSLYGHLNDRSVTAGETVAQGQVIGHAGTTYGSGGYSSGPHLHFEIRVDGVKKDPEEYVDFSMHK